MRIKLSRRFVFGLSLLSAVVASVMQPVFAADATTIKVTASGDDGHSPKNTIDGIISASSRWSEEGDGAWIKYDYLSQQTLNGLSIAFHEGDKRTAKFDVQVSNDGSQWNTIFSGKSPEKTLAAQRIAIGAPVQARYMRIVGHGNSLNNWNSITEVTANISPVNPNPVSSSASSKPVSSTSSSRSSNQTSSVRSSAVSSSSRSSQESSSSSVLSSSRSSSSQASAGSLEKELMQVFELEGDSPFRANNVLVFSALESKWVTGNGHGWRNELKIKDSLRKDTDKTYETFSANVNVKLSNGAKTIIAQYHEASTGTLLKVYVADTAEKVYRDSTANDGVFDVFVRITGADKKEIRHPLGTIKSGDSFDLAIVFNKGDVVLTALGQSVSSTIKQSTNIFFKFGDYLQAQDPETGKDYKPAEFKTFYEGQGITVDQITYTNVKYTRN